MDSNSISLLTCKYFEALPNTITPITKAERQNILKLARLKFGVLLGVAIVQAGVSLALHFIKR